MDEKSRRFTKEIDSSKDELSKLKKNIILKRENFEKLKSNVSIEQNIRDAKLEQFNDLKSKRSKEAQERASLIYELDLKKKELFELGGQLVVLKDSVQIIIICFLFSKSLMMFINKIKLVLNFICSCY